MPTVILIVFYLNLLLAVLFFTDSVFSLEEQTHSDKLVNILWSLNVIFIIGATLVFRNIHEC